MAVLQGTRHSGLRNLVGFEVGPVLYAIDIHRVREIIRPLPTLPLPHTPPAVLGVSDHRGAVVPVVDLRLRFGVGQSADATSGRWVVVSRGKQLVALVVDRVAEVFGGEEVSSRKVPEIGAGDKARGIVGVYSHEGKLAFVVDPDQLASVSEEIDIEAARAMFTDGDDDDT